MSTEHVWKPRPYPLRKVLSLDVTYGTLFPDGTYCDVREDLGASKEDSNRVWGWADGLVHKYYDNHATGHCSLQAMIDFDVGKFEELVKADIVMMTKMLDRLGPPRRMTRQEATARGYKGWEKETKEEAVV